MSYGSFKGKYLGQPPRAAKALELLLEMPPRDTKKDSKELLKSPPGGSPFISLGTAGPLVSEISPWVLESRAQELKREILHTAHSLEQALP